MGKVWMDIQCRLHSLILPNVSYAGNGWIYARAVGLVKNTRRRRAEFEKEEKTEEKREGRRIYSAIDQYFMFFEPPAFSSLWSWPFLDVELWLCYVYSPGMKVQRKRKEGRNRGRGGGRKNFFKPANGGYFQLQPHSGHSASRVSWGLGRMGRRT